MALPKLELAGNPDSAAALVAQFLRAREVDRIFGLQGGHIQPIWDYASQLGIPIIDVREEGSAVHMAHAHAELTGSIGVALVTAGPGVTNTVTAVANASVSRAPVLVIGGCPPVPQDNMGPLQGIPHVDVLRPITRYARTIRTADQVAREMDEAVARAFGDGGEPGPVYIEFPTDVLRETVPPGLVLNEHLSPKPPREIAADAEIVARAAQALWSAQKPLVISGRGARGAGAELMALLEASSAAYLDTQESRGLVPSDHSSYVGAMRATAMAEADLVVTVGRKLDYQLAYGSPVAFPHARFVRIADNAGELIDNRRGDPEIFASASRALRAILKAGEKTPSAAAQKWRSALRWQHEERTKKYKAGLAQTPAGSDGRMHPNRIFAAIAEVATPDMIGIADGGDILSFARLGLDCRTYLDAGAFGCLGVGTPFAVAAALAFPGRMVISVHGDGAFGIHAMEIDTAVRHNAKAVFIIANNGAWNIERYDQAVNYGGRIYGTELRFSDYAGMARALGAYGERVEDPNELDSALQRALDRAPALLDVVVTRDAISSDFQKGLSVVPDYQPLLAWDKAERDRRATRKKA